MPKPAKAAAKPKAAKKPVDELPVKYPEVTAEVKFLTPSTARELLGWTEEGEEKWGAEFLLTDENGNKVRCVNNPNNRPFYRANCEDLTQEQLNQRWRLNGEPIIIDKHGYVHNGQHTLLGLVLSEQRMAGDDGAHWRKLWKGKEFGINKLVVYGIDGNDETVNTIDTAKSRSLTDVLYRSGLVPKDLKTSQRKQFSKALEFAVRTVWSRSGAGNDAYTPRRTHSEAMDFFASHRGIMTCLRHVWDEEGDSRKVSRYLSLGTMAGLMYLWGVSGTTDTEKYKAKRSEKSLDLEFMPKAEEFVTMLAGNSPEFAEIREALVHFDDKGGASVKEREAVLCKSWLAFAGEDKLVAKNLIPKYIVGEEGVRTLTENCNVHGIDLGNWEAPKGEKETADVEEEEEEEEVEADPIEEGQEEADSDVDDMGFPKTYEDDDEEIDVEEEYVPNLEEIEATKKKIRNGKGH